jgi:hypothetical protein
LPGHKHDEESERFSAKPQSPPKERLNCSRNACRISSDRLTYCRFAAASAAFKSFASRTTCMVCQPGFSSILITALRHLIAFARRLSTSPLHDLVESLEIGTRFSVGEKPGRLKRRNLFRHRCGNELVDAGSILPAQPLDRL